MDMDADPPFNAPHDPNRPDASINVTHSLDYWNNVSSDVNGMLGGYPQTSRIDLQGSSNFLTKLRRGKSQASKQPLPPLERASDCGAGIGRITKGLLLGVARRVDVVEPVKKFTDELVQSLGNGEYAGDGDGKEGKGQVGEVINLGLQDWIPEAGAYDLIWNQWCLGHLTDAQLVVYLRRCKNGLIRSKDGEEGINGWIVVKENLSTDIRHKDIYDEEDSSVTRSDDKFRRLFKEAGLKIVATEQQRGMPKELFPVRIYALRPE
ncbi:Nn.00g034170.m01.CDS01 [Neocucurbitaria sp. VM-36]